MRPLGNEEAPVHACMYLHVGACESGMDGARAMDDGVACTMSLSCTLSLFGQEFVLVRPSLLSPLPSGVFHRAE